MLCLSGKFYFTKALNVKGKYLKGLHEQNVNEDPREKDVELEMIFR